MDSVFKNVLPALTLVPKREKKKNLHYLTKEKGNKERREGEKEWEEGKLVGGWELHYFPEGHFGNMFPPPLI